MAKGFSINATANAVPSRPWAHVPPMGVSRRALLPALWCYLWVVVARLATRAHAYPPSLAGPVIPRAALDRIFPTSTPVAYEALIGLRVSARTHHHRCETYQRSTPGAATREGGDIRRKSLEVAVRVSRPYNRQAAMTG